MPGRASDIQFPLAGVKTRLAFQTQEPYSCADAVNVWPRDPIDNRMRGGSRPGLQKVFDQKLGGPVHLLSQVRVLEGTEDDAITTLNWPFIQPAVPPRWLRSPSPFFTSGYLDESAYMAAGGRRCYLPLADRNLYGFVPETDTVNGKYERRNTYGDLILYDLNQTASTAYTVRIEIEHPLLGIVSSGTKDEWRGPYRQAAANFGSYVIHLALDDTNPEPWVNSVACIFVFVGSNMDMQIIEFVNGAQKVLSTYGQTTASFVRGTFRATKNADGTVSCVGLGGLGLTNISHNAALTGTRVGFGMYYESPFTNSANSIMSISNFSVSYQGSNPRANRNVVVAVGGANASSTSDIDVWFEDTPNILSTPFDKTETFASSTNITNANGNQLIADESLGRLYIGGEYASTAKEIWVFDPTEPAGAGTGVLTAIGEHDNGSGVGENTAGLLSGNPPTNLLTLAVWRNRIVCVERNDAHNLFMSKVGDPLNWDTASLPVGAALQLNTTGIDTGRIAEPINAIISSSDDYLIIGCQNSIYRLVGDPTLSGQVDQISKGIGIIAPKAWALGPDGELLFLSHDGLYGLQPGPNSVPLSISREMIPQQLRDIEVKENRVLMEYDVRNRGIFIGVTPTESTGQGSYFWFDWEVKGFWPLKFQPDHEPFSVCYRKADNSFDQRLMFGCRDGYIRSFFQTATSDDGIPFDTQILIGPLLLGGGGYNDGMLREVIGQLGLNSANVTLKVRVGDTIEDAFNATGVDPLTLKSGKSLTERPLRRGGACFIELTGVPNGRWAYENLTVVRERLGKQRL